MKIKYKRILQFLNNLFFPSVCEGCGEVGSYICDKCIRKKIQFKEKQECYVCKKQLIADSLQQTGENKLKMVHKKCRLKTYLDGVFVVAKYSKFIENYIGDIKYEFYFAMIDDLVKVMNIGLEKNINFRKIIKVSTLTFVPLNPWRKRWRGFNQAEEIAKKVSKYWDANCIKLLKRKKKTKSQVGLKRRERLKNLSDAFELIKSSDYTKQFVIVVDDVMTTGSTLEECAKVLKHSGVKKVYGLVFARG